MIRTTILIALLVCGCSCAPALQNKLVEAYDRDHTSEAELEARIEKEVWNVEVSDLEDRLIAELQKELEERRIDYRLLEGRFHVLSIELRDVQEQCHEVIPP